MAGPQDTLGVSVKLMNLGQGLKKSPMLERGVLCSHLALDGPTKWRSGCQGKEHYTESWWANHQNWDSQPPPPLVSHQNLLLAELNWLKNHFKKIHIPLPRRMLLEQRGNALNSAMPQVPPPHSINSTYILMSPKIVFPANSLP